jgi:ArsR family transcriptional regulator
MMGGIAKYGCHVNKIVEKLGLPQSTVSQHLAALRSAGLVTFEKNGAKVYYKVTDMRFMRMIEMLGELS